MIEKVFLHFIEISLLWSLIIRAAADILQACGKKTAHNIAACCALLVFYPSVVSMMFIVRAPWWFFILHIFIFLYLLSGVRNLTDMLNFAVSSRSRQDSSLIPTDKNSLILTAYLTIFLICLNFFAFYYSSCHNPKEDGAFDVFILNASPFSKLLTVLVLLDLIAMIILIYRIMRKLLAMIKTDSDPGVVYLMTSLVLAANGVLMGIILYGVISGLV